MILIVLNFLYSTQSSFPPLLIQEDRALKKLYYPKCIYSFSCEQCLLLLMTSSMLPVHLFVRRGDNTIIF